MSNRRKDTLALDRIAFLGRTFAEYLDMFGLDRAAPMAGPVLDCPAGPSSFAAGAARAGGDVTACDALYGLSPGALRARGEADIAYVFEKFDEVAHLYAWGYYRDRQEVISLRKKALEMFLGDFESGKAAGRYVPATLPRLPFPDGKFALVLSGHFLFLYGDRMGFEFHLAALRELLRVSSGEVRVFPLAGLDARPYPRLGEIIGALNGDGMQSEVLAVPLEFQRGASAMLRISKREV